MAGMLPASVFGLRVPAGGMPIPAAADFPATFRITMAALDPSAVPQLDEDYKTPRATLKLIRMAMSEEDYDEDDDEDMDDDDIERIKARLQGIISDEDSEMSDESEDDSEEEKNGGPSDPAKAKAAKRAALAKKIQEELAAEEMHLDKPNGVNGKSKGKAKAIEGEDSSDDEEIDSDEDGEETEEFVLCTLDPEKNYQQPLDITVGEHEQVFFCSNGTHDIYLTGNYVLPMDMDDEDDENEDDYEEDDYDLPPDSDELDEVSDSEEDALDSLKDPRIEEIHSEDEAPKLVKAEKKGKNKRPAEEDAVEDTLDDLISKTVKPEAPATNGEQKLSKKQAKKLKKNDGQAVAAAQEPVKKEQSATLGSDKKKVQFAKNLELGPTGSPKVQEDKKEAPAAAAKSGPRVVGGVTVEDKKVGNGKAAKKGDRIEMRYIGKLKNGKQFDANKKGKPFGFKLGTGEVIKGWDIGIVGMAPGGERRITIPSHLAYGKKALPGIPANSDLIFDVKCIAVN
ncbi:hypothetical protein BCR34DRAFT_622564 [Clohesyomyces aquaticus]|uniref:peptidylprolyl isomerase n=1 Tax=Clohesyomyces aquaticus TaxID=1231657 RepID=A0A1Y2A0Y0_9PLEO|nr:hypothetical protein BCR34DRAFT_622564 [Clohesyomyces aquaticus]